jgi:cyanophycinase
VLLAICSSAIVETRADENILKLPPKAVTNKGALVIVGGDTPPEARDEFVQLAGGSKARLVVIPWASPHVDKATAHQGYEGWLRGVASLEILDKTVTDASLKTLEKATGVWIAGGIQSRLASLYGATQVPMAIRAVLERGGVVGGTSAGAAIMSRIMICSGNTQPEVGTGFGLLEGGVVDQHFTQRRRETRLLSVVQENRGVIGLGIDEKTALIVCGNQLRVMGANLVTLYLPAEDRPVADQLKPREEAELVASGAGRVSVRKSERKSVAQK